MRSSRPSPSPAATLVAAIALGGCGQSPRPPLTYTGYAEAEFVRVAAPIAGRLESLAVHRGQTIARDTPLFALETTAERAARQASEQQLNEAAARLAYARAAHERAEALLRQRTIGQEEYDRARAEFDARSAAEAAARASLDRLSWEVDQKSQRAPCDALVHDTLYRAGEWVPAGQPVVVLFPPENVLVRFFLPAPDLARVSPGDPVEISTGPGAPPIPARLTHLATEAEYTPPVLYDRNQRSRLVYLAEATPDPGRASTLHPGQPVDVRVSPAPRAAPDATR